MSRPTINEWMPLAFIAYTVIDVLVCMLYGLFIANPVCCDDHNSYQDAIR